jgi:hypothetical protein
MVEWMRMTERLGSVLATTGTGSATVVGAVAAVGFSRQEESASNSANVGVSNNGAGRKNFMAMMDRM